MAETVAVTMRDPDAPGGDFVHWIVFNIPKDISYIPPGQRAGERMPLGALQGINGNGQAGYLGPMPPAGSTHTYVITVYTLDTTLKAADGASIDAFLAAIQGHLLQQLTFRGTYTH
jgi:Raf kinase inhibitor-like YbhB/YbcL family protein